MGSRKGQKADLRNRELKFKTGASGTEGLEGLSVSCSCGAIATLKGAFDKDCFKKLDELRNQSIQMWMGIIRFDIPKISVNAILKPCKEVRPLFTFLWYIVRWSSPVCRQVKCKIEQSKAYDDCVTIISDADPEERTSTITRRLSKWVDKIALEIGAPSEEVKKILIRKWLEPIPEDVDVTSIQYRVEEYAALAGEVGATSSSFGDFSREEMDIPEYNLPHIKAISLIDKVRVVNALIGFFQNTAGNDQQRCWFCRCKGT